MFGMDLVSLVFLAFMVIVSGFVAYAGDLLGRSLGKKRLTIMGLRPRHTAAVMTGVFGGLATLIAVVALVAVSEPVRTWMFEGNKAREELGRTRKELDNTGRDLERTQASLQAETAKLAEAGKKVAASEKQVSALRATTAELKKSAELARSNLAGARKQLTTIQAQYRQLLAEASALSGNNREIVRQNKQISERNLQLEFSIGANERKIQEQTKELSKLNKTVEELQGTISGLQKRLEDESTRASAELKKLTEEIKGLESARELAEVERAKAVAALNEANALYESIRTMLQGTTTSSRVNPITYQRGDELARIAVRSSLSAAEARAYVLALLESAHAQAAAQGAGQFADKRSAALVPRIDPNGREISAEAQLQRAISELAGKPKEQVVVASSFINTFRGEPVALAISVLDNGLVYRQGEVVGEVRIDGRETERAILDVINEYASGTLAEAALKNGMIPALGKPQPLGALPSDQIFEVVRLAREAGRPLRLMFLAAQDTRAADRLRLELRLR